MCTNGQKSRIERSTLSIRRERRGVTLTLRESRLVGVSDSSDEEVIMESEYGDITN